MNSLKGIWDSFVKLLILKVSDEQRIRYLRKRGIRIGEKCRVRTMDPNHI